MKSTHYQQAGVNIDSGNKFVDIIKPLAKKTLKPGVLAGIGGFNALYEIPMHEYQNPILVSSTDGVGSKLRLAIQLKQYDSIGIDLVAMCVNDLLPAGAKPLFFLDYYATSHLNLDVSTDIIKGIVQGCTLSDAALVGGETAEMPIIYQKNDFDLAGFTVGIVDKSKILKSENVQPSDNLIALGSSGLHSNGFSLIHRLLEQHDISLNETFGVQTFGEVLLTPTRIYVKSLLPLFAQNLIHMCAHVTGGGLIENIPRVLPFGVKAIIDLNTIELSPIFSWIKEKGSIEETEMLRTFNCGVGMVLIVSQKNSDKVLNLLQEYGENAWILGKIEKSEQTKHFVEFIGNLS